MGFSSDYFAARAHFRQQTEALGWDLESFPIAERGPRGEELTIDVALSPNDDASNAVIVSSGVHGVEGPFGSAVQSTLLERWAQSGRPEEVRLVLLHALNPSGFCIGRRVNEANVDLNRNFLRPGETYSGVHPTYARLDPWLNPPRPRRRWEAVAPRLAWEVLRTGLSDLTEAIAGGQYAYPRGLFYGGAEPAAAIRLLETHLRRWIANSSSVIHLDFHTGLGRWATYQLLLDEPLERERVEWLRRCFGPGLLQESDNEGIGYQTRGSLGQGIAAQLQKVDYTYLCAEFGTYPLLPVLAGLRAENQAHHWEPASSSGALAAKDRLKELFCPKDASWRERTLAQSLDLVEQAFHAFQLLPLG